MRKTQRTICCIALLSLALIAIGCGRPAVSTSTEEATVTGTVTIDGKLATSGEVTFDPSNIRRKDVVARTAPIGPDGQYTIKTLVGENSVRVNGVESALREPPPPPKDADSDDAEMSEDRTIAYEYEELQFDVRTGENKFDIQLGEKP